MPMGIQETSRSDFNPPHRTTINRPRLFLSAVSAELHTIRQTVAVTVRTLGFDPVSQDDFPTGHGELGQWLRTQIDSCEGLVQIVGEGYGDGLAIQDKLATGDPGTTPSGNAICLIPFIRFRPSKHSSSFGRMRLSMPRHPSKSTNGCRNLISPMPLGKPCFARPTPPEITRNCALPRCG